MPKEIFMASQTPQNPGNTLFKKIVSIKKRILNGEAGQAPGSSSAQGVDAKVQDVPPTPTVTPKNRGRLKEEIRDMVSEVERLMKELVSPDQIALGLTIDPLISIWKKSVDDEAQDLTELRQTIIAIRKELREIS